MCRDSEHLILVLTRAHVCAVVIVFALSSLWVLFIPPKFFSPPLSPPVFVDIYNCMGMCIWRSEVDNESFSTMLHLVFETDCLTEPGGQQFG